MIFVDVILDDLVIVNAKMDKTIINVHMGEQGQAGRTPIKGVDYFTYDDRKELIKEITLEADFESITEKDINILF